MRVRISDQAMNIQSLTVYPNPAGDFVFVKIISLVQTRGVLKIVDLTGKELQSQQVTNTLQPQTLDITSLSGGKYMLQWLVDGRLVETQSFEKVK